MKAVRNDNNNQSFTLAEQEAIRHFEASNRKGQVLFHPWVAAGQPAPNLVSFFEKVGRFAVTALEGRHAVGDGNWFRQEADGSMAPVDDDPLEQAWQANQALRTALREQLNFKPYAIPVAWFPDMEADEAIMEAAASRGAQVLFGRDDLVERLAKLPTEDQLQSQLGSRFVKQEVAALSRPSAVEPEPVEKSQPVNGGVGALNIGRVETMNVHITIANGGNDDPPVITVQSQ